MKHAKPSARVLALYVTRRGIAFVFFSSATSLHDWGTKGVRDFNKHAGCLTIAKKLIEARKPDVVVIEDATSRESRRFPRIRRLYRAILQHAERQKITTEAYSREEIKEAFAHVGKATKHQIATAVAQRLPEIARHLPRKRKAWESESGAQGLFDAASLGLMCYGIAGAIASEANTDADE